MRLAPPAPASYPVAQVSEDTGRSAAGSCCVTTDLSCCITNQNQLNSELARAWRRHRYTCLTRTARRSSGCRQAWFSYANAQPATAKPRVRHRRPSAIAQVDLHRPHHISGRNVGFSPFIPINCRWEREKTSDALGPEARVSVSQCHHRRVVRHRRINAWSNSSKSFATTTSPKSRPIWQQ